MTQPSEQEGTTMPVFAVAAVIDAAVILILHLIGHGTGALVIDLFYVWLLLVALHLATGWSWAVRRTGPPQ
jgi:hypothetical protein